MHLCSAEANMYAGVCAIHRGQTGLADELGACVAHNNGHLLVCASVHLNVACVCLLLYEVLGNTHLVYILN